MAPPLALSAVVPTHDTRELTLRCLAALATADPPLAEVIVVDDGSRDGTAAAIAASYPATRLVRHDRPRGFTAAANAGLALAGGDVLLLLNSDTEVAADAPGALVAALAADSSLGIAGAALFYPGGDAQWSGGDAPGPLWLFALASGLPHRLGALAPWRRLRPVSGHGPRPVAWVTGAAMAIQRAAWEAAGPLDERFVFYAQDLDFCLRARASGWATAVVPAARILHHHGATVSATGRLTTARHDPSLLWADLVRFAAKHGGPPAAARAVTSLRLGGALQRLLLSPVSLLPTPAGRRARSLRQVLGAAARAASGVSR
jgi:N-acetylglucosaminyl-diphospho-decaprenol L-rhamnosyltransferase